MRTKTPVMNITAKSRLLNNLLNMNGLRVYELAKLISTCLGKDLSSQKLHNVVTTNGTGIILKKKQQMRRQKCMMVGTIRFERVVSVR